MIQQTTVVPLQVLEEYLPPSPVVSARYCTTIYILIVIVIVIVIGHTLKEHLPTTTYARLQPTAGHVRGGVVIGQRIAHGRTYLSWGLTPGDVRIPEILPAI